jgi:predicted dithiol-disulfide oxidoreductase (DUF899 family)
MEASTPRMVPVEDTGGQADRLGGAKDRLGTRGVSRVDGFCERWLTYARQRTHAACGGFVAGRPLRTHPAPRRSTMSQAERSTVEDHAVVSAEEWITARQSLLASEKEFTRLRDELSRKRRALPWVRVEKSYVFDGPDGQETLEQLFQNRSQLVVYHFMFPPDWKEGCKHCSFWADHYDGTVVHLNHRDVTLVVISRAPLARIEPFKKRMGWRFKWLSSAANEFNRDYGVSFTPAELENGTGFYNYVRTNPGISEREGASVFYRNPKGEVFHTYSCYARGIDMLNGTYQFLDLVPKGRDEEGLASSQAWVRHHDRYED